MHAVSRGLAHVIVRLVVVFAVSGVGLLHAGFWRGDLLVVSVSDGVSGERVCVVRWRVFVSVSGVCDLGVGSVVIFVHLCYYI